jgi:hypothetical protein
MFHVSRALVCLAPAHPHGQDKLNLFLRILNYLFYDDLDDYLMNHCAIIFCYTN